MRPHTFAFLGKLQAQRAAGRPVREPASHPKLPAGQPIPGDPDRYAAAWPKLEVTGSAGDLRSARADVAADTAKHLRHLAPEMTLQLARQVGTAYADKEVPAEQLRSLASLATRVQATRPNFPLDALVSGERKLPGLLELTSPAEGYIHSPTSAFIELLTTVPTDANSGVPLARAAAHVASELGHLDRDPVQVLPRIRADWFSAITRPQRLSTADGRSRPEEPADVAAFMAEHPELPPELAVTAGLHLTRAQLEWLCDALSQSRSRTHQRALRDAVFAAVDAQRLDLLDAVASSSSTRKAKSRALGYVARQYREGGLADVPFDRIVRGLEDGGDPVSGIEAEATQQTLAKLGLGELAPGAVDPQGLGTVKKLAPQIAGVFQHKYKALPGGQRLTEVYTRCIEDVLAGTWPQVKYENEVGRRQLAICSEDQAATWRRGSFTVENGAPSDVGGGLEEAIAILRGLPAAMRERLSLEVEGAPELGFDEASAQLLRGMRDERLTMLRASPKGSAAHRELSKQMGPICDALSAIELALELERSFEEAHPPSAEVLRALDSALVRGRGAASAHGAGDLATAIDQALALIPPPRQGPLKGRYACDEDSLEAHLTSHGNGSCLHATQGFNRTGLVAYLADAQYRMGRVYVNGECTARSILRLFKGKVGDYQGPILYMDRPLQPGGYMAPPNDAKLLYQHMLKKAAAMKVPLVTDNGEIIRGVVEPLGHASKMDRVQLWVDRGNTGLHQSQAMSGEDYFIAWPGWENHGYVYTRVAEGETTIRREYEKFVVRTDGGRGEERRVGGRGEVERSGMGLLKKLRFVSGLPWFLGKGRPFDGFR